MRVLQEKMGGYIVTIEEEANREELSLTVKFEGKEYMVEGEMAYDLYDTKLCDKGYYFDITQLEEDYDIPDGDLSTVMFALNNLYRGEDFEYFVDWK